MYFLWASMIFIWIDFYKSNKKRLLSKGKNQARYAKEDIVDEIVGVLQG